MEDWVTGVPRRAEEGKLQITFHFAHIEHSVIGMALWNTKPLLSVFCQKKVSQEGVSDVFHLTFPVYCFLWQCPS